MIISNWLHTGYPISYTSKDEQIKMLGLAACPRQLCLSNIYGLQPFLPKADGDPEAIDRQTPFVADEDSPSLVVSYLYWQKTPQYVAASW